MAAKDWNEIITEDTGDGIHAKLRREFTVNNWDEVAEIDTATCLQGSIVFVINEWQLAVFNGEKWVDASGNQYPKDPPMAYWVMDSNWRDPNTYDLPVMDGDSFEMDHAPLLHCFAGSPFDDDYVDEWTPEIVSSDETVMSPDNGRIFFFKAGTAEITATLPEDPYIEPDSPYYPYMGQSITFTITALNEDTPGG